MGIGIYSEEKQRRMLDIVPNKFKINATDYLCGIVIDELWLFEFLHEYPEQFRLFVEAEKAVI